MAPTSRCQVLNKSLTKLKAYEFIYSSYWQDTYYPIRSFSHSSVIEKFFLKKKQLDFI